MDKSWDLRTLFVLFTYLFHLMYHNSAQAFSATACYAMDRCNTFTLTCDNGKLIQVTSLRYGIKDYKCNNKNKCLEPGGCCVHSTTDCFGNFSQLNAATVNNACTGKTSCGPLQAPFNILLACSNKASTYVIVEYQCVVELVPTAVPTTRIPTTPAATSIVSKTIASTTRAPATQGTTTLSATTEPTKTPIPITSHITTSTEHNTTLGIIMNQTVNGDPEDSNMAAILAGVLVPVAIAIVVALVIGFLLRRRRQRRKATQPDMDTTERVYSEIPAQSVSDISQRDEAIYDPVYESRSSNNEIEDLSGSYESSEYQGRRQNYDIVYEPGRLVMNTEVTNDTPTNGHAVVGIDRNSASPNRDPWYRRHLENCRGKVSGVVMFVRQRVRNIRGVSSENDKEIEMSATTDDEQFRNVHATTSNVGQSTVDATGSETVFNQSAELRDRSIEPGDEDERLQKPTRPPPFPKQKVQTLPIDDNPILDRDSVHETQDTGIEGNYADVVQRDGYGIQYQPPQERSSIQDIPNKASECDVLKVPVRYDYDYVPDPKYDLESETHNNATMNDRGVKNMSITEEESIHEMDSRAVNSHDCDTVPENYFHKSTSSDDSARGKL